ncbi:MAG: hypothetical protein OEY07_05720 [Gammaproteobacteria bacterium]|nr:hypothetical protein [Gammaproteobacteria bacterium]
MNVASINGGTTGTTDVDTVVGADSSFINTWSFTGYTVADGSNGTLTNNGATVNFNNIETATGGTGADQFTVTTTGGIDTVDGGSSSGDELVVNSLAADTINWTISSDNAGSVATNKVGSFTQIQTLTGGDGVDNFAINGAMTTINGGGNDDDFNINVATTATINGNGGDDTFDIFANVNAGGVLNGGDGDDTFTLQNLGLTVASIIGGDANEINGDTLVSAIEDNYWNMTGTNTGTISGITTQYIPSPATAAVSDGSDRVTFSGVENLTGNQNSDYFKMNLGSDITGNIVGGDGAGDPDVFDVSTWGPNPIPVGNMAGIEELFGGGGGDFYAGGSGLITWIINGDGSGTVNGINFSGFTNLFGSDDPAGDDLFILQAGGFVTGTIDGRGGNNTVEAGITGGDSWDVSNTWNITGAGTGSVVKDGDPASLTDFVNIQNLTGGEGNDRFNFQLNGVIAGTVDGGGTGTNIIDMSAVNAVTALHVRMGVDADPLTMDVLNVGQIRGNGNASSTLYGDATTASTFNVKQILDINATLTDGADDGEIAGVVTFENFANLTGGAQSDSFTIETSGTLSGAIDGVGAGNTLTVQNAGTNSWVINDANIGTVTKLGSGFSNVENLVGGAGSDDFLVTGSGSIGSINGVGNGNSLNMNIAGALIWTINSADGGNNDLVAGFSGIQTLTGSTGNDTFGISADYTGTINGNSGGDTFNITSSVSGILNGDAGTDTYNINDIGLVVNNINGGTEVDTLNLANEANYVVIDAANGGRVYNTGVVVNQIPANQRSGFAGVENINGNANIDNFRITGVGSINNITGGNGSNSLNMDIAAVLNWSISSANGGSNDRVSSFTGIQTLTGSTGNDTFGISADYTGTINGNSGGDTFNITSSVSGILNGDAGTDTYNINDIGLVVNNINGGTEVDTLNLANEANYVVIDAANGGRVYNTGVVVNQIPANQRSGFAGVENINGNANIDNFRITGVGSINNITGGIGGNDLNMDLAAALNWTINSANGGGNDRVSSFTGIQTLTGSTGNDTFGISADFTGTINAGSGGDTFNITSNVSGNLNGQGGGDTYNINGTGLIVSNINGGGSVDTLNLANEANYVVIDAANGGRVYNTGVVVNQIPANQRSGFTSVENINGSDNIDDFRVTGTGSISNITGGIGSNSLNMDIAGNLNWTINSADGGSNGRVNSFSGMQALTGSTGNDTFGISADYTGTINGNNGVDTFNITSSVSGILNGDAGTDTYNINSLGLVVNGIDGGADTDTLNLANEANYVVIDAVNGGRVYNTGVVANQIPANQRSGFADVENINGNTNIDDFRITGVGSINNITGGNGSNNLNMNIATALNWTINSANGGSNDRVSSFTGMQTLTGSTGVDTFAISADFTGIINANNGNDIFNITASVSGNLNGQSGDDVYNLQTGNLIVPNIDGGEGGETNGDQIVGFNETNYWNITGVDSGTLARTSATPVMVTYANIENLTGSSNTDYFNITATGNLTAIGTGGVVNGAGGNNDTLAGRLSSDNNWSISAVNTGQVVVNGETIPYAKFSSVENLQGGDAIDVFALTTTTATIGSIDGGTVVGGDPATYNEIIGRNTAEIWTIDSGDGGNVSGVIGSFSNIQNLTGALTQNDTFTFLVGGSLTGLIDGRGNTTGDIMNMTLAGLGAINVVLGEDVVNVETINGNNDAGSTLVGTLGTNNWNITGANDGNVDIGSVVNFTNFANLSGNDDVPNSIFSTDIFTFVGANGSISGRLDGKRGQNDQLFVQTVGDVIVTLLDGAAPLPGDVIFNGIISTSTAEVVNVDGIETITANGADTNLLVAANTNNTWLIDGANSGLVMPAVGADAENTIRFNNFDNIRGGTENDNFRITSGNISGIIDGNENFTNTDIDSLDYSLQPGPYTVDLSSGSVLGSVKRAEGVIGNSTNMTLRADDINNIWDIAGDNSGVLNDAIPASRYTFSGFTYLVGGDANDTFNVTGSGGLLGGTQPRQQIILRGGLGDDELNVMLASGTGDFGVIFDGQAGQNSVNIDGGTGAVYSAAYTPNTFTLDAIVYDEISYTNDQNANNYRVRFANVVDVLAEIAVQDMTVNGNAGVDSFVLGSGIATDTGTVTRTLKAPLDRNYFSVNGDTGVYYANATNLTVNGDNADTIDVSNVSSVTGTLTLTGDTVTTSGSISTSGLVLSGVNTAGTLGTRLNTSVSTLSVINSGSVYLDEANGITDIVLSGTTVFDLLAANDVISTSAITTSAGQVLTIDAANISLTGPNSIAGVINLNGANVTLNNTGDTNLGNVTASGTLAVNVSGGGLTDSGQVEGLTVADFNVSGGSVVLDTAGNDFGSTILTVDGGSATLVDSNDITLDSVNITGGDLSVTATGINVGIVSADNVRLNARSGAIVDNNNDDQVNISTGLLYMRAGAGIGEPMDPLEVSATELDVMNTGAGGSEINISNDRAVTVTNLVNIGDITFSNIGNVTVNRIDADYDTGTLTMNVENGDVIGTPLRPGYFNYSLVPDISAYSALILAQDGNFGTSSRPISMWIKNDLTLVSITNAIHYFNNIPPPNRDLSGQSLAVTTGADLAQALIEVESLAEIDPAIFTEVRNYYHDDVAISMPLDQRYVVDDNEDEEKKRKKEAEEAENIKLN